MKIIYWQRFSNGVNDAAMWYLLECDTNELFGVVSETSWAYDQKSGTETQRFRAVVSIGNHESQLRINDDAYTFASCAEAKSVAESALKADCRILTDKQSAMR